MTPKLSPSFFTSATVCLPSEPITLPHPQPGMPSPHLGAGAVCMCDGPQSDLASGGCERSRWVRAGPFCGWESPTSAAGWAFAFRRKIWLSLASRPKISHHFVCFNLGFFGKTAEGHPAVFQAPPLPMLFHHHNSHPLASTQSSFNNPTSCFSGCHWKQTQIKPFFRAAGIEKLFVFWSFVSKKEHFHYWFCFRLDIFFPKWK